jgi:bacteriorhodopsin
VLWLSTPEENADLCSLADGGNVITPDGEMVFYGVLDVLAKPVFVFYHLWSLRNIQYE